MLIIILEINSPKSPNEVIKEVVEVAVETPGATVEITQTTQTEVVKEQL